MAELKDMRAERDSQRQAVHFQPHGAMATDHRPRSLTPHNRDRRPAWSRSHERPQYYSAPNTLRKGQAPFRQTTSNTCGRCGNENFKGDFKCYARDKVCHCCNGRGHLKPQCKTKLRELAVAPAHGKDRVPGRQSCVKSVFKTQSKKLSVLLPWISNHKHKIEEKF